MARIMIDDQNPMEDTFPQWQEHRCNNPKCEFCNPSDTENINKASLEGKDE